MSTATAAREQALDRVARHAPADWLTDARQCVIALALSQRELTSDDVWMVVGQPPEPRALGAVMRSLATSGAVIPTDRYRPSVRPACHARPVRVWRKGRIAAAPTPAATLHRLREKYAA